MKSKRYCPYPVIHYNGNSLATTSAANLQSAVVPSSENYLYSGATLPSTSLYYYLADPNSLSPMPYASPGKFLLGPLNFIQFCENNAPMPSVASAVVWLNCIQVPRELYCSQMLEVGLEPYIAPRPFLHE